MITRLAKQLNRQLKELQQTEKSREKVSKMIEQIINENNVDFWEDSQHAQMRLNRLRSNYKKNEKRIELIKMRIVKTKAKIISFLEELKV